ncbi:MAG: protein kinase family protein [bacterium]
MFIKTFKKFKLILFTLLLFNNSVNLFSMGGRSVSIPRSNTDYNLSRFIGSVRSFSPFVGTPTEGQSFSGSGKDKVCNVIKSNTPIFAFRDFKKPQIIEDSELTIKNAIIFGEPVACLWYLNGNKNSKKLFKAEIKFLNTVSGPNIIEYKGNLINKDGFCVLLEAGKLSIYDVLNLLIDKKTGSELDKDVRNDFREVFGSDGMLSILQKIKILKDLVNGIREIHDLGYVNRDIKHKNAIIMPDSTVKLIDFTTYEQIPEGKDFVFSKDNTCKGTLYYMPPENLRDFLYLCEKYDNDEELTLDDGIKISKANDIYSFALLMYEILYECFVPYEWDIYVKRDDNSCQSFDPVTERSEDQQQYIDCLVYDSWRPALNRNDLDLFNELIERCWADDPQDRPTANEILEELTRIEEGFLDLDAVEN